MREDYTHISLVLDRSGSMSTVRDDTIGGFNTFLKDQRDLDDKCTFSMIQFDTEYEILYTFIEVKEVPELNNKTFVPRGGTALLDAIGQTVIATGNELSKMKEEDRPSKVLFVILTDGEENSSREYTKEKINEMIKHQEDVYKWKFIFLAANQDAIQVGNIIGTKSGNSLSIAASSKGVGATYSTISTKLKSFRGMSSDIYATTDTFTEEDRKQHDELINN